jgi:hypothetical protein
MHLDTAFHSQGLPLTSFGTKAMTRVLKEMEFYSGMRNPELLHSLNLSEPFAYN